jgi:pyrimidine operon attenuation protein/uracil phosphoribosyltransferase
MTSISPVSTLIDIMVSDLHSQLKIRNITDPVMVGIHTGGLWVATELHRRMGITTPLGALGISFYRDDFSRIGLHPQVKPSALPVDVDGRDVILVDDVLYTGRTIRAALNEIFDFGRPASVMLAILVDRGGRELPIQPDILGEKVVLESGEQIKLSGPSPLSLSVL